MPSAQRPSEGPRCSRHGCPAELHACRGQGGCAVQHTAERILHKWQPVLVHRLPQDGPLGFTELEGRVEGISAKVLTESLRALEADGMVRREVLSESLRALEADGMVRREVLSESPLRVRYHLTEAARDLAPVVRAMEMWGRRHLCAHGR